MKHHSICSTIPDAAIDNAEKNLRDILALAIEYTPTHSAVIAWDTQCELAIAYEDERCVSSISRGIGGRDINQLR